jgi:phage terminase small subunit
MARNPGGEMRSRLRDKERRERFCEEYLLDLHGTKSAIRAGYTPRSAEVTASRLLSQDKIRARIAELQAARAERTEISADRVVTELAKLGFSNMLDYVRVDPHGDPVLDLSDVTRDQAAAIREWTIETYMDGHGEEALQVKRVKFRLADKLGPLDKLARHLGLYNDTLELKGKLTLEQLVNASFNKPE